MDFLKHLSPTVIVIILLAIIVLWAIGAYNGLIRLKNMVDEAWSGISVQLKRRHDLIPNLVATTKGLSAHEKELMVKVTEARGARTVGEVSKAEGELSQVLSRFVATAEAYPQIKADQGFTKTMTELSNLEEQIQMSRRYYNGAAREYNTAIATFPRIVVARLFGFLHREYFELDSDAERAVPKVEF